MTDLRDYLDAVLGDTEGRLHIAVGSRPYLTESGKYAHKDWTQTHFAWPDERDRAVREIGRAATDSDVYVCPYLMHADKRTPGGAVARPIVHADVDGGGLDLDKVRALSGFVVASGTPGNGHVYVPLSAPVPAHWHKVLERGLVAYLGADPAKINTNDVLRPPGTYNHKPTVFTPGSDPAPVQFLVEPDKVTVDPHTLAHQLGVELTEAPPLSTNGHQQLTEPVDLTKHPRVQHAIAKNTNDRSADTMRVVAACRDAGLTLPQTRYTVATRADLAGRLDGRGDDDVLTCWLKVVDSRQERQAGKVNSKPTGRPRNVQSALDTFRKWLHIDDTAPVLAVAAAIVANLAEGDPVWFLLIGPPSGGKTEILSAVTSLEYVVSAATITEAALLSGTARKERAKDATGGLLRLIGDFGILLAKDFTSVLSQNKDTAKAAMAALRETFDGSWDRPVGTDGGRVLHWAGKCGFIGGATPSYDRYGAVVNALGDRYLLLRLPDVDAGKQARAALKAAQHEKQMRSELADAMLGLIAGADLSQVQVELSDDDEDRLVDLATFTAGARTTVERDGYTGELLVIPQPEGPARLVKALRQLYGALSALGVDYDTRWGVLARIALDCAPAIRVPLMLALLNETGWRRTAVIAEAAELVTKTAARHLDDLTLLGIAERTKKKPQTDDSPPDTSQADNSPHYWQASQWLRTHWPQVGQRTTTKREEELKDAATGPPDSTPFGSSLSHLCGLNERPRGAD